MLQYHETVHLIRSHLGECGFVLQHMSNRWPNTLAKMNTKLVLLEILILIFSDNQAVTIANTFQGSPQNWSADKLQFFRLKIIEQPSKSMRVPPYIENNIRYGELCCFTSGDLPKQNLLLLPRFPVLSQ